MGSEDYEINRLNREIERSRLVTEGKKREFIDEIKNGLGEEIGKPKEKKELTRFQKFWKKLSRVFR